MLFQQAVKVSFRHSHGSIFALNTVLDHLLRQFVAESCVAAVSPLVLIFLVCHHITSHHFFLELSLSLSVTHTPKHPHTHTHTPTHTHTHTHTHTDLFQHISISGNNILNCECVSVSLNYRGYLIIPPDTRCLNFF